MAIINIWIFPIFISLYSVLTIFICVLLSIFFHHFPAHWPYLSDFTKYIPAKNAYTIMTNHILLLLLVWMYLKHRELKSYFRQENIPQIFIKLSWFTFILGIGAITSYQLTINFPGTKIKYIEEYGNRIALLFALLYIWSHTFLSFKIKDPNLPRLQIFLIRLTISTTVLSCCAAMVQATRTIDPTKPGLAVVAIYEWFCYFSFCIFLLTDSYEFKFMIFKPPKLIIRGCTGYDERVFESIETSEDDDQTPAIYHQIVM